MRVRYFSLLFVFFCSCSWLFAQDTHYWTYQFGTRSALMSGAVVGGAKDNTMIFYNPGALGFMENTTFSVNANAYNVSVIRIENALGDKADYLNNQANSVPLLAGGLIRMKTDKVRVGYGIMAPVDFKFKGIARFDGEANVINEMESPGLEELVGESSVSTDLRELVVILASSSKINDNWSVGLSNMFNFRSHTYYRSLSGYVFANNAASSLVGANLTENMDMYNLRYYLKFGVLYKKDNWSAGLTITSPSINIFGKGTTAANVGVNNLLINTGERISGVATDRQAKLKTRYKSPLSVAFGVNYRGERSGFGIAAEYFGGVDLYSMMEPEARTFVRPDELAPQLGSDLFLNTPAGARPVFNVAVGYEYFLDERWTLYLSGRNNMSYFDKEINRRPGMRTTISSWDIYHLTSGFTLQNNRTSISLGLLLSSGRDNNYEQSGNLADIQESDLVRGTLKITKASYYTAGILFGFTYFFDRITFTEQ